MANQIKTTCIAALAFTCLSLNAQAAILNFSVTGIVDYADTPNDFGLGVGDNIYASGTFDDSALLGTGAESVSFGQGTGNIMNLDVGNFFFSETDDNQYLSGAPTLYFINGVFDGINFKTDFNTWSSFDSKDTLKTFTGEDENFNFVDGYWDVNSYSASPVPVPAAVWLFGSGLLGLVGVARRKK